MLKVSRKLGIKTKKRQVISSFSRYVLPLFRDLSTFLFFTLFRWEESEEFGIDEVGYLAEIFGILAKLQIVAIYDDEFALVVLDPLLIAIVQALEVVDADALLEVSASLLDVLHQGRNAALDVYHEVWELDQTNHEVEEVGIIGEITVAHHADVVQIRGKDTGILEDGTILHDGLVAARNLHHVMETLVQEVNLEIERPALHILIIISEIRIIIHWLEVCLPAISLGKHFGQCSLAATYISCYCYMHRF